MCTCNNCNEITLFKGTNGVGVSSTVNNEDGTFTIYYTDGTSYTSPDLTGPAGAPGAPGTNPFKFTKEFVDVDLSGDSITITAAELISCLSVPTGCLFNNITSLPSDLHVQLWQQSSGYWTRVRETIFALNIYDNGNITAIFLDGSGIVKIRMVVIA